MVQVKSHADPRAATTEWTKRDLLKFHPRAVVVASSTGGPMALETFLSQIKVTPLVPIFIAQHLSEGFTKFLSARLMQQTGIECREAVHKECVKPGIVYFAPGNFHMRLIFTGQTIEIHLDQSPRVNDVRPAADLLFESASLIYGKETMAFVLTGMGRDGCQGAINIKKAGGGVMIQDENSSVVWGMPGAVFAAKAFDCIDSLEKCSAALNAMVCSRGEP